MKAFSPRHFFCALGKNPGAFPGCMYAIDSKYQVSRGPRSIIVQRRHPAADRKVVTVIAAAVFPLGPKKIQV